MFIGGDKSVTGVICQLLLAGGVSKIECISNRSSVFKISDNHGQALVKG